MTFSICVREQYHDDEGTDRTRYGVAVTTRLPSVGSACPFVSEHGVVCTQSSVNRALGSEGIRYIDDGLAAADALQALLNTDDGAENRQLHGVSADSTFTHTGDDCGPWGGHTSADNVTVAGNRLVGPEVVDRVFETYRDGDRAEPLESRLIDALAAGYDAGGDHRVEELPIQSAAMAVRRTEPVETMYPHDDLRVDATETPMEDLRATYELAKQGYADFTAYQRRKDD